jgi:hypothetical protein
MPATHGHATGLLATDYNDPFLRHSRRTTIACNLLLGACNLLLPRSQLPTEEWPQFFVAATSVSWQIVAGIQTAPLNHDKQEQVPLCSPVHGPV